MSCWQVVSDYSGKKKKKIKKKISKNYQIRKFVLDQVTIFSNFFLIFFFLAALANPGFEGPLHHFMKLDHNHREVCKPRDRNDPRFAQVVKFIREATIQDQQQPDTNASSSLSSAAASSASDSAALAGASSESMTSAATSYFRSMYKWNWERRRRIRRKLTTRKQN